MNLNKITAAALTAVMMLSMSGCYFLPDEEEVLPPPVVNAGEVTYTTLTVNKKTLIKQVVNSGTVKSKEQNNLFFEETGGTIKKIYVKPGDTVKKGTLIAELETYDLDYRINEKKLYLQRAQLTHQIAVEKGYSQAEIDKAKLDIEILKIDLQKLEDEKAASKLYSNFAGTISYKTTKSIGEYVNPGETIATVVDINSLYMRVYPEDYRVYKVGAKVQVRVKGVLYDGFVTVTPEEIMAEPDKYDDETDEQLRYYVQIEFEDDFPKLTAIGTLADSILVIDKREDVIVISNTLIKNLDGQKVVYLFKDNVKIAQPIEIGLQTGSESEIISGLEVGDQIIIR